MTEVKTLLDEIMEERQKVSSLPILDERWYILEIRDASTDEFSRYEPPETHKVSPYFDNEREAARWIEQHTPSHGSKLMIRKQFLREFTEKRWSSY